MFETLLILGASGFLVMTLLGFSHGHGGGAHGHGHAGHAGHGALGHGSSGHSMGSADSPASLSAGHHGVSHGSVSHSAPTVSHGKVIPVKSADPSSASAPHSSNLAQQAKGLALMFISPLDIFSICLGMGMSGILLKSIVPAGTGLTILAFIIGFAFDLTVTRSILRIAMKFAGEPSAGLEGMVSRSAKATTSFGRDGKGVVEVLLDGQSSQVLATLDPSELSQGVAVHKGDTVLVLEVDPRRNVCRVSRDLAPADPHAGGLTQP